MLTFRKHRFSFVDKGLPIGYNILKMKSQGVILMHFRKLLCLVLALTMLTLCGCDLLPTAGSHNIKVDDVKKIIITNGLTTGNDFTVEDRDSIRSIINQINSYKLENGNASSNGFQYKITVYAADGSKLLVLNIVNKDSVSYDGKTYTVNAKKLRGTVEQLECATLTDEQLLRTLFEGNYFDDVTILNENGDVSIDKILSLKSECPALFELLSRPSAITSLGTYGVEMLEEYLNSEDSEVRQKAEEIAEILKNFFPNLKDKIDKILEK